MRTIYFFLAKILIKLENAKSELELNYKNVCKWFILMQNDEHIFGTFSFSQHKKIQFNLNDEICLNKKFELIQTLSFRNRIFRTNCGMKKKKRFFYPDFFESKSFEVSWSLRDVIVDRRLGFSATKI